MNPYLLFALGYTPQLLDEAWSRMPAASIDRRTQEGRFSPREVAAHLADWEPIMRERMRQCIESPGSRITARDEGEMAVQNRYEELDPLAQLQSFRKEREETVRFLQGLGDQDWLASAIHEERGVVSVRDIANTMVCHDLYHVEQLSTARS